MKRLKRSSSLNKLLLAKMLNLEIARLASRDAILVRTTLTQQRTIVVMQLKQLEKAKSLIKLIH